MSKINLRQASAITKELKYTILPDLQRVVLNSTSTGITTLLDVNVVEEVSKEINKFNEAKDKYLQVLSLYTYLRAETKKANSNPAIGIDQLLTELNHKETLLTFYTELVNVSNAGELNVDLIKERIKRAKSASIGYSSETIHFNPISREEFLPLITQLKREIKEIKNDKLTGINFHTYIEISDEMKSTLESLALL